MRAVDQDVVYNVLDYFEHAKKNRKNNAMDIFPYIFIVISFISAAIYLYQHASATLQKLKDKESAQEKRNKILKQREMVEEKKQSVKTKIEKLTRTSKKHWAEKSEEQFDEDQLNQLMMLINDKNIYDYSPQELTELETSMEGGSKPDAKQRSLRKHQIFNRPTTPIHAIPRNVSDRLFFWHENLPGYNLTKKESIDPDHSVYPLRSGNEYVFINILLYHFLAESHPHLLPILLKLCAKGKTQMPKHVSGFVKREEGNAKKLDVKIIPKKTNKHRGKQEEKSKQEKSTVKTYIKGKPQKCQARFFGVSVAKKDGKVLYELNGVKLEHKKGAPINYFPSELEIAKYNRMK